MIMNSSETGEAAPLRSAERLREDHLVVRAVRGGQQDGAPLRLLLRRPAARPRLRRAVVHGEQRRAPQGHRRGVARQVRPAHARVARPNGATIRLSIRGFRASLV